MQLGIDPAISVQLSNQLSYRVQGLPDTVVLLRVTTDPYKKQSLLKLKDE
jgi:hypothetical protein